MLKRLIILMTYTFQIFLLWLKHTVNAKLIGSNNYKQIFKEPITVERKDLENLIMLANKLSQYL